MSPGNDRGARRQESAAKLVTTTTNSRVTRCTDGARTNTPIVTGAVVVELAGLSRWSGASDRLARVRLSVVPLVPAGAEVVIRCGDYLPPMDPFCGEDIGHVRIRIEAAGPEIVRRWIAAVRECS